MRKESNSYRRSNRRAPPRRLGACTATAVDRSRGWCSGPHPTGVLSWHTLSPDNPTTFLPCLLLYFSGMFFFFTRPLRVQLKDCSTELVFLEVKKTPQLVGCEIENFRETGIFKPRIVIQRLLLLVMVSLWCRHAPANNTGTIRAETGITAHTPTPVDAIYASDCIGTVAVSRHYRGTSTAGLRSRVRSTWSCDVT